MPNLTEAQLAEFDERGYLFMPGQFTLAEAAVLKQASLEVFADPREEVWRESSGAARTAFAAHRYNEPMRRLGRRPHCVRQRRAVSRGEEGAHKRRGRVREGAEVRVREARVREGCDALLACRVHRHNEGAVA